MARIDSQEVEAADAVIRRAYYRSVRNNAVGIIGSYFDGEIGDEESLQERIREDADSAMTYTSDQYKTVYASEASSDGLEALEDLGSAPEPSAFLAAWAFHTYEADLRSMVDGSVLGDPAREELNETDRLLWLIANHAKQFLLQDADGHFWFLIGLLNEGQNDEINLGLVYLTHNAGARGRDTLVAKMEPLASTARDLLGLPATAEELSKRIASDPGALRAFFEYAVDRQLVAPADAEAVGVAIQEGNDEADTLLWQAMLRYRFRDAKEPIYRSVDRNADPEDYSLTNVIESSLEAQDNTFVEIAVQLTKVGPQHDGYIRVR